MPVTATPRAESRRAWLEDRLHDYLREVRSDTRDLQVEEPFRSGWSLESYPMRLGSDRYVLRLTRPDHPVATDAAREACVVRDVRAAGISAPDVAFVVDDPQWLGVSFAIYEHIDGTAPNVWSSRRMRPLVERWSPAKLVGALLEHAIAISELEPPTEISKLPSAVGLSAEQYTISGDAEHWLALLQQTSVPRPSLELGGRWLVDNAPSTNQVVLQHNDLRLGNLLLDTDQLLVAAVLDWEFAGAGDPMCDIGYAAQPYCLGKLLQSGASLDLEPDPTTWMLREYNKRVSGVVDADRLRYFVALGIFKMAVALILPAVQRPQYIEDFRAAWLELPILSLTHDLIAQIRTMP